MTSKLWIPCYLSNGNCCAGDYTTFMYLEDDIPMQWQTLLSWAHDNEALEPMGLQRQFYRTEIAPWNGRPYMTDARGYTSLDKAESVFRTVHLDNPTASGHKDFVALSDPYSAVYVASKSLMKKFAASPQWTDRNFSLGRRIWRRNGCQCNHLLGPSVGVLVHRHDSI